VAENQPSNPYEGEPLSDDAQGLGDEVGARLDEMPPPEPPNSTEVLEDFGMTVLHVDTAKRGPVFVLFASDLISPKVVRHWADLMTFDKDCPPGRRQEARRIAMAMELWQKDQGMVP
jgi:hypothetical protein